MRKVFFVYLLIMLSILISCSNAKMETKMLNKPSYNKTLHKSSTFQLKQPPKLTIEMGNKEIRTLLGGYSWSYCNPDTKEIVAIETEAAADLKDIIDLEKAENIDLDEPISFNFTKPPLQYEINVYDENGKIISTYENLKNLKEKGKVIIEILAAWEEGEAAYAVGVEISS